MFALYYKELYIVKEPLTKNCTCQSWRAKQLAICEEIEPLKNYINNQNDKGYPFRQSARFDALRRFFLLGKF